MPGITEPVVTLAAFLKIDLPSRSVRLCDGGQLTYQFEKYEAFDSVYGSVISLDAIESGFGDVAEGAQIVLAPNPEATVTDWWNMGLFDRRVRMWLGEVDADGFTVSSATLVADLLVDTYERRQGLGGEEQLVIDLMSRAEKLFLRNEGNVCAERFHQLVWPGENGFDNCTDLVGYLAWGAESPPRGSSTTGGSGSSTPAGRFVLR